MPAAKGSARTPLGPINEIFPYSGFHMETIPENKPLYISRFCLVYIFQICSYKRKPESDYINTCNTLFKARNKIYLKSKTTPILNIY